MNERGSGAFHGFPTSLARAQERFVDRTHPRECPDASTSGTFLEEGLTLAFRHRVYFFSSRYPRHRYFMVSSLRSRLAARSSACGRTEIDNSSRAHLRLLMPLANPAHL